MTACLLQLPQDVCLCSFSFVVPQKWHSSHFGYSSSSPPSSQKFSEWPKQQRHHEDHLLLLIILTLNSSKTEVLLIGLSHLLLLIQSFILNLRLGFLANHFLHKPFPFLPDWFHGLSDHLMFLFCSTAGFVCMVC